MTDREHLLLLRADMGTVMAALAALLLDTTNVRSMADGGQGRENALHVYERAKQIADELQSP